MINLPSRTPTSFIYFGAAGLAAYFSNEVAPLRWLAYCAALMFFLRGPLEYCREYLVTWHEDAGLDLKNLLRTAALLTVLGEWVCYVLVGYWVYRFALAI